MPASLDPKIVLIGASPGNSPIAGDKGAATGYTSIPTVFTPENSHFYYKDGKRYTEEVRYLARAFCLMEGTVTSERDALSLCSHFNLGTKRAGTVSKPVIEQDVVQWVSRLLNTVHNPDLIVLFGLLKILQDRDQEVSSWWNCKGGLQINWNKPDHQRIFSGYTKKALRYREWIAHNSQGNDVRVVTWPQHPSKPPFTHDMKMWESSVAEGLASNDALLASNGDDFWLKASKPSLNAIWNNVEDETYGKLLER